MAVATATTTATVSTNVTSFEPKNQRYTVVMHWYNTSCYAERIALRRRTITLSCQSCPTRMPPVLHAVPMCPKLFSSQTNLSRIVLGSSASSAGIGELLALLSRASSRALRGQMASVARSFNCFSNCFCQGKNCAHRIRTINSA